jgi:acyl-CoA dehydrogenase
MRDPALASVYVDYFNETHGMVRDTMRRFVNEAVKPHIDAWEEAGAFPREIYPQAGQPGLAEHRPSDRVWRLGRQDVFLKVAASELMRSGSGGFVASLGSLDIGLPPAGLAHGLGGAQGTHRAAGARGREDHRPGHHRAQRRLGCGQPHPRGATATTTWSTAPRPSSPRARADYYTVAVRTGEAGFGGVSLLLIEKGTPGFTVGRKLKKMGWWASDTAELFFQDCRVPAENLLGPENSGFFTIMANFQAERLSLAIMAYMTAQLALEQCLAYVKERTTFGKPLSKHQVIRHKLAEMATQVNVAREYTYRCAARMQAGESAIAEVSMAKNFATSVSTMVTDEAVQIFGGMGYMRESLVERLYRDNRILSIGGGTHEIMNEIISEATGVVTDMAMPPLLSGLRVLDLTRNLPGRLPRACWPTWAPPSSRWSRPRVTRRGRWRRCSRRSTTARNAAASTSAAAPTSTACAPGCRRPTCCSTASAPVCCRAWGWMRPRCTR